MSPGHLSARVFELFEAMRSFKDHHKAREILMTALAHLTAAVEQSAAKLTEKDATIADLQKQLAAAQTAPASGATDAQLDDLTSKLEAIIGAVADPSADTGSGTTAAPVVGTTSTVVSDPSTGNTTTVDHTTGQATTTNSAGAPVATDPIAAQAATQAAQAAGVVVPPVPMGS